MLRETPQYTVRTVNVHIAPKHQTKKKQKKNTHTLNRAEAFRLHTADSTGFVCTNCYILGRSHFPDHYEVERKDNYPVLI